MSENRTVVYTPEAGASGGGNGMMAMLAPLLQQKGIDPNLLIAMQGKNGNSGFGGDGSWFLWIIFLFFLFPLFGRNGWGNNGDGGGNNGGGYGYAGIPNLINNDNGRELLMQAITGNGQAIGQLATTLNCSVGQIQQGINAVTTQLQQVGNQVGQSSMQIINAVQAGNCQIAQAIADCCCKTQNAITTQGYENQLAMCNQTHSLTETINGSTLALRDGATANTQVIIAKLDAMQNQALQDKINALTAEKATLSAEISQRNQNATILANVGQQIAPLLAGIQGLQAEVDAIKCRMPNTVPVVYPQLQVYNPEIARAAAYGAYAGDVAAQGLGCGC